MILIYSLFPCIAIKNEYNLLVTSMKNKNEEFRFFWENDAKKKSDSAAFPDMKTEIAIPVRVAETENEIIVLAELRGFRKENIHLSAAESFLEIAASGSFEKTKETKTSCVQEKKSGVIKRAFTLPARVDPDMADATFENGILTIRLPKARTAEKKRRNIDLK